MNREGGPDYVMIDCPCGWPDWNPADGHTRACLERGLKLRPIEEVMRENMFSVEKEVRQWQDQDG